MDTGILSKLRNLSYSDLLLMINMLTPYKQNLTLMLDLFRSEDDLLKFLDLFAGRELRLPSRSKIYFVLFNIDVYKYYNAHLGEEDALSKTARHFDITKQRVQTIVERVNSKR